MFALAGFFNISICVLTNLAVHTRVPLGTHAHVPIDPIRAGAHILAGNAGTLVYV